MRGLFGRLLEGHEAERHSAIAASVAEDARSRRPPSLRVGLGADGFLRPAEAASLMGVGLAELSEMARTGLLETRPIRGQVWIRPAIVSRLAIRGGAD